MPLYQAKADLLRVLGNPARIRVLELLAEREHAGWELLAEIPIEAGSLSQQLAVLRRAALVGQRRDRGSVVYRLLVPEVLVKGGEFHVVRPRGTYEELIGLDSLPPWLD